MAVTFDAVGPSSSGVHTATSPASWSHVVGGSANLILAGLAVDNGTGTGGNGTPTFAGVPMSLVKSWQSGGVSQAAGYAAVYSLASPATGSGTESVTFAVDDCAGGSLSFAGYASLGAIATADSNSVNVTSGSVTVPSTTSGGICVCFVVNGTGGTAFTTQAQRFSTAAGGGNAANAAAGATGASTGSAVTFSWTQASDWYAAIAFEVQPAAGGSAFTPLQPARRAAYRAPASPPSRRFRQAVPAQQAPPVAEVTRRQAWPRGLARRGRVTSVVRPQLNPPYPFAEVTQRREAWPRALARKGRQVSPVPAQVNPPYPVAQLRQPRRPRGLFPRRGHGFTPVPAQQAAAPNPPIAFQQPRHLRMLFQRRGRIAMPVPAQQSPAAPAFTWQPLRHPRLLLSRRPRGTVHVPGQQDAAPRQRGAIRLRVPASRRARVTWPPQAAAPAPAQVSPHRAPARALAFIRRRFSQLMPWPQAAKPSFSVGTLTASTYAPPGSTSVSSGTNTTSTSSGTNTTTTSP